MSGAPGSPPLREGLEVSSADAAEMLRSGTAPLVDIRRADELERARIDGAEWIPMGDLLDRIDELDVEPDAPIAVLCHHGVRSLKMTLALHAIGYTGARSVAGGIEAWSHSVDPTVPRYS
ncbi:MAG: rhodanese-like domain-containing protein [Phycisphaeraceae bacterium]|nr:MAG: rhodanese-like domain-containing protein [Phycisphaeraceae bacterium]